MKEFAQLSYCIIRCAEQERPEESVGESQTYDIKRMVPILILSQVRMRLKNFRNPSIPLKLELNDTVKDKAINGAPLV